MRETQAELKLREKELATLRISLQERTDQVWTKTTYHRKIFLNFLHAYNIIA